MALAGKVKCDKFNDTTDVKVFLTKVEIVASIKGYEGEKKAQFLTSKLLEPAFDIYMRLSDDDRKSFARIKEELLKEFEKGQLNREEAIHLLSSRQRQPEESAQTFAYKLLELVKLSYPTFPIDQQKTIAKDYFTRGVHPDMQIALKSWTTFKDSNINALATETTRLELAGVKSYGKKGATSARKEEVNLCDVNEIAINSIAEKVIEKLNLNCRSEDEIQQVDYRGQSNQGRNNRGRGGAFNRSSVRGRVSNRSSDTAPKKCRSCQSTDHLICFCPLRFCQACSNCPNYQA